MSTFETAESIEADRDAAQAARMARTHDVQYKKLDRGPFVSAHYTPICPSCGALGDATFYEDAKTVGRSHETSMVADALIAEVEG